MEGKHDEQATIDGSEFFKSLGRLEALAKGATPEDLEKAQLFHTRSNSEPAGSGWPGGKKHGIGNEWDDSIGSDGTDYKAARKAIADKVMKGEALSPDEVAILKSDQIDKGGAPGKEGQEVSEGSGGAPGKEGQEACKSQESIEDGHDGLQKAIEMSPFLAEFAKAFNDRLNIMEERQNEQVIKAANSMLENMGEYLEKRFAHQGEFNKSLAEVVSGIGHGLHANMQQTAEMAQAPAGAPKSTLRAIDGGARPIEKSFAGPQGGETLTKSQVLGAMTDMVEKGDLNPLEVVKYENTDQIRPDLLNHITQTLTAAG
jgi:cytochrome c556